MPVDPGKYDAQATVVRRATNARAVVVIVLGGDKGPGFSVQADSDVVYRLPEMLRRVATKIEENLP
jgi:hypothetical protein